MNFNPFYKSPFRLPEEFFNRRFVYRVLSPDTDDDDNLPSSQNREREQSEVDRERQASEVRLAGMAVSDGTRFIMKRYLASEEPADIDKKLLVERFLRGEIESEAAFTNELENIEREDSSWRAIFERQRAIRKKIQDLQYKAEGYMEIVSGTGKQKFGQLIKRLHELNKQDREVDHSLKVILTPLVSASATSPAVLDQTAAREIYMTEPSSGVFKATLDRYKSAVEAAPEGASILRKILSLKKTEVGIEDRFARATRDLDRIISDNLSKVRKLAEQEVILKNDGKSVGITLKPGTEVVCSENGASFLGLNTTTLRIQKIEFETVPVFDNEGRKIDETNGVPKITINGLTMTLGRFKKWADAADATEKIETLRSAEVATDLIPYDIKILKGMKLAYPVRKRDRSGILKSELAAVTINKIDDENKRIYFDREVVYQPGFEDVKAYDLRDSLSYGEFVRWWHRYNVEKSVGLKELQDLLLKYNEIENREFGYEPSKNPPILVTEGEELRYPDESDERFMIRRIDPDGVVCPQWKKTFPEFFYWVRNNHVQKVEKEKKPEELAEEEASRRKIEESQDKEKQRSIGEIQEGLMRHEKAEQSAQERTAGSLTARLIDLWHTTQFLSFQDLLKMGHEIKEFVKRKHERRSKGRYGDVGARLGGTLGTEFERVKQAAADEEVEKYKSAMEKWGADKVRKTLYVTNNRDVAKAAILTLVHEGEMRWDDHHVWKTLNRLTARYTLKGAELYIPELEEMPQGESGEEMAKRAVDALWGIGKGYEWYKEGINRYNSRKNDFEYEFKQLENDPKGTDGPRGECVKMLKDWKDGKFVDPMRFEAMIDGAIKYGKMRAEDKMFFIMCAVVAERGENIGQHGETLFHIDRMGELNSKWLNQFPLLDFFTQEMLMDYTIYDYKEQKWGKKRKLNLKDYQKWVREEFPKDYKDCKADKEFSGFMWETMLMSDSVRTRMSKGIRHAENMDHDDAHLFVPPLTPTEIDGITTSSQGDLKKFSNAGYANAYAGFNQYFVSLSRSIEQETDKEKLDRKINSLRDGLVGYIRYDGIINNRFKKEEGDRRARLDEYHFQRAPVVDSVSLGLHRTQLRNLIMDIADAYGRYDEFRFLWDTTVEPPTGSMSDRNELEKQRNYETRLEGLGGAIEEMVKEDNGKKALDIIRKARRQRNGNGDHSLRGLPGSKQVEA